MANRLGAGAGSCDSGAPKGTPCPVTPAAGGSAASDVASAASDSRGQGRRKRPASLPALPTGPTKRQQQGGLLEGLPRPATSPQSVLPQQPGTPPIGDSGAAAAAVLAELSAELGQACQQQAAMTAGMETKLCSDFQAGRRVRWIILQPGLEQGFKGSQNLPADP